MSVIYAAILELYGMIDILQDSTDDSEDHNDKSDIQHNCLPVYIF